MKLEAHNYGFEGNLPEERIAFKIQSSAKLFNILSSGIYEDKILAVIRELSCNAFDAHIAAGKRDVPFSIKLPNYLDATFAITDEGTGIDPAMIGEIFWTYGSSTKADSNEFIGALGLGSKSPFAYTKSSFTVRNRFKGREYIYMCFINENGTPDGSKLAEMESTGKDGITIEFAVKNQDIDEFANRCKKFFMTWDGPLPTFSGSGGFYVPEVVKTAEGKGWYLKGRGTSTRAIALMGNVPYPINHESIPNLPTGFDKLCGNPFVIKFPMGALNFASSREGLEYDEKTCKALIAALEDLRKELVKKFHDRIFGAKTVIEFINLFSTEFARFKSMYSFGEETDDYLGLLFGKARDETITFDGEEYEIENLMRGQFTRETKGMTSFGLYSISTLGFNLRLAPLTTIDLEDLAKYELETTYESYSVRTGQKRDEIIKLSGFPEHEHSYTWTPIRTKKCRSYATAEMMALLSFAASNPKKVSAKTRVSFKVSSNTKVMIIINDLGSVGTHRAAAIINNGRSKGDHTMYLFAHNPDLKDDFTGIVRDTRAWVGSAKFGIDVKLISELEDLRPKVEVDNDAKEIVKLPVAYYGLVDEYAAYPRQKPANAPKQFRIISGFESTVDLSRKVPLKFSELIAMDRVFYTLRDRSKNPLEPDGKPFVFTNYESLSLIRKEKLYADLLGPDEKMMIINLTESESVWMKKKGVKLVSVSEAISGVVMNLAAKEQVFEKYHAYRTTYLNENLMRMIDTFGHFRSRAKLINASSPLHRLFDVMNEKISKHNDFEKLAERVKVLSSFITYPRIAASATNDWGLPDLAKRYPFVEMSIRCGSLNLKDRDWKELAKYINDTDERFGNGAGNEISHIFESILF